MNSYKINKDVNKDVTKVIYQRTSVSRNRVKSGVNGFNAISLQLKRGLVTAILVISVLAMLTASASATDYYVRTGGLDGAARSGLVNDNANAWQTISYAVGRGEVGAGDTIHVAAGDYSDNVDVDKAHLTLQGEGRDVVTVTAAATGDHVFEVTKDYVSISGFKATGATGWPAMGIYLSSNVDHCNISGNNCSDNCIGIYLNSSSNNTLTSNTANSNSDEGIRIEYSSNYNTLTNNTVNSNRHGISIRSSSNYNTLTNNTANSNEFHGIFLYAHCNNSTLTSNTANSNGICGICLYTHCNYNTLTSNTANSNSNKGICLYDSSNNTLTSNTVNSNTWYGIYLESSSNNTLTSNTANSNDHYGISIRSSSNYNTLTSNTVNSNSDKGICLFYSSDNNNVSCNWVQNNTNAGFYLQGGSTGNTIANNSIIANGALQGDGSYHYQFYNDQSDAVVAENNYWGTNDNSEISASINENPGTVDYDPFLEGPAPCAPVPDLSAVLLFAAGLLLLVGYVWIGRNK